MARRSPTNPRYQKYTGPEGKTRKSAAAAKPKKASSSELQAEQQQVVERHEAEVAHLGDRDAQPGHARVQGVPPAVVDRAGRSASR